MARFSDLIADAPAPDSEEQDGDAPTELDEDGADAGDEDESVEQDEGDEQDGSGSDGPDPGHPRFHEIYGRLKHLERREQSWIDSNAALRRELEEIRQAQVPAAPEDPEPDIDLDPGAWRDWNKRDRQRLEAKTTEQFQKQRLNNQVEIQRSLHEDYDDAVKAIMSDLDTNEKLRAKIWGSPNPPAEAYKYAMKKNEKEKDRESNRTPPTPPGGTPPKRRTVVLTKQEKAMAQRFGMTDEQWVKDRDGIDSDRRKNAL